MKKILKWGLLIVAVLGTFGFVTFLYFIPPLTTLSPDEFIKPTSDSAPRIDGIADPAERMIAERGRYIVLTRDCAGCHTTQGPKGPRGDMFLAGGMTLTTNNYGTLVSRNLTPDKETGIGGRSDEEIKAVLRNGVFHTGRAISPRSMPWVVFSKLTDEDLHAVITYLRHIKAIRHSIPEPKAGRADALVPSASEVIFALDAGK